MHENITYKQRLEEEIARLKEELSFKHESERQLTHTLSLIQSWFDSTTEATFIINTAYQLLAYNNAASSLITVLKNTSIQPGALVSTFLDEEEMKVLFHHVEQCKKGHPLSEGFRGKKNGQIKYSIAPIYNAHNTLLGFILAMRGFDSKKESKQLLKLSHVSLDRASDAMFWIGADASIKRVNKAACKLLGYTEEELKSKTLFDIDAMVSKEMWAAHWQELKLKKAMSFESVHLAKDGKIIPTLNSLNFFKYKGQEYKFILSKNVSESKKDETDIQQSEELYKEIVENAPDAIIVMDLETMKFIDCNENALKLFKIDKNILLNFSLQDLNPQLQPDGVASLKKWERLIKQVPEGIRPVFEWVYQNTHGEQIICEVRLSKLYWKGKLLVRASIVDITERKVNETRLLESEQRYKALFERIPDAVYSLDKSGNVVTGNAALAELTELPLEKVLNTSFFRFVSPEDLHRTRHYFNRSWQGHKDSYEIDIITEKGSRRTINVTAIPIIVNNAIVSVYATAKDITKSKNYTKSINEVVQLLNNIYESISDAFFSLDRQWKYIVVNKEYERLSGLSRVSILGKNYWEVTPGAQGSEYSHYYFKAVESQQPIHYESQCESAWYYVAIYPSALGLSVYFRDITSKKEAEKKVEDSLHEKEILLTEIHHRVKNNLAVISSLLRLQSYNVEDENIRAALQESTNRIQSIALVHEKLYKSETFSNIPMREYVAELVEQISQSYKLNTPVKVHIEVEQVELDIAKSVPCGLILNELISNAYKHAFHGVKHGDLWIKLIKIEDRFELCIKDNGKGFPQEFDLDNPSSMGLQLVKMLTEQLRGELKMHSVGGVETIISFR